MRLYITFSWLLVLGYLSAGCKPDATPDHTQHGQMNPPQKTLVTLPWSNQLYPTQPSTWVSVMADDTMTVGNCKLSFSLRSGQFNAYYQDQESRDSISSLYSSPYYKRLAVERYLESISDSSFSRLGDTLKIYTPEKEWQLVNTDSQRYSLEHILKPQLYLINSLYRSGNSYFLFNTATGRVTYLWGKPYLSPDSTVILVANNDQKVQYSANGLQYFQIYHDSVVLDWELGLENWGPSKVQWINRDTVLIQREYVAPTESEEVYITDVVELVIKPREPANL